MKQQTARGQITITDLTDAVSYSIESSVEEVHITSENSHGSLATIISVFKTVGEETPAAYPCYLWVYVRRGNGYTHIATPSTKVSTWNYTMSQAVATDYLTTNYDAVVIVGTDELREPVSSRALGTDYVAKKEIAIRRDGKDTVDYKIILDESSYATYEKSGDLLDVSIAGKCYKTVGGERSVYTDLYDDTVEEWKLSIRFDTDNGQNPYDFDIHMGDSGTAQADMFYGNCYEDGTGKYALLGNPTCVWVTLDVNDIGSNGGAQVQIPINIVAEDGEPGKTGKAYYLAGEYENKEYKSDDFQTPLVHVLNGTTDEWYWLDASTNKKNGSFIAPTTDGQTIWKKAMNEYKVILTEALFTNFAKLDSAIITCDWMISQHGRYNNGGTMEPKENGETWDDHGVQKPYYMKFEPSDPQAATSGHFAPNYAVNLLTGTMYGGSGNFIANSLGVTVQGTIRATNFFHNVCFFREGGTYTPEWYYLNNKPTIGRNDATKDINIKNSDYDTIAQADYAYQQECAFWAEFEAGKYYEWTDERKAGFHGIPPSISNQSEKPLFVESTYEADVIICWPKVDNWNDDTPVYLPSASEYEGKMLLVSGFSYNTVGNASQNTYPTIIIECSKKSEQYSFAPSAYIDSSKRVIFASEGSSVTMRAGGTLRLLSVKDYNGRSRWVTIENATGGDIIIDGESYGGTVNSVTLNERTYNPNNGDINIGAVVKGIKLGTTDMAISSDIVTLPAYPTTLPASDVYSWAKQSSKPSYTLDEVGDGNTRKLSDYALTTSLANYLPLSAGSSKQLTGTLYSQNLYPKTTRSYNIGMKTGSIDQEWGSVYAQYGKFSSGLTVGGKEVLTGITSSMVTTALGYTPPETDTNTWKAANTSQEGYVPKLVTGGSAISTQSTSYVLTYVSGNVTPSWMKLPANAFEKGTGTVTKVSTGTGLTGGDITTSGTIALSSATQTSISNGETAYGWGDHSGKYLPLTGGTLTNARKTYESTLSVDIDGLNIGKSSSMNRALYVNGASYFNGKVEIGNFSLTVNGTNVSLVGHTHNQYFDNTTNRTKNTVLAAPSDANGAASFRALVASDIPSLGASKITSGQLALAQGGTGVNNTSRDANTFFAGPTAPATGTSDGKGTASWRKMVLADLPFDFIPSGQSTALTSFSHISAPMSVSSGYLTFDYLTSSSISDMATKTWVGQQGFKTTDNDTKNTAGGDNTTSKIFLVGMTSQTSDNGTARTYSNSKVYAKDGALTASTYNGLTLTNNTTGFSIKGGSSTARTLTIGASFTLSADGNDGQVLKTNGNGTLSWVNQSSGSGTVTSVRVQASSPLQSSTSTAQTTSLNTTISFVKQDSNKVLAGPSSGTSAGAPSFRALVAADIPSLDASKITSGVLAADRIPSLNASKITAGQLGVERIPDLSGTYLLTTGGIVTDGNISFKINNYENILLRNSRSNPYLKLIDTSNTSNSPDYYVQAHRPSGESKSYLMMGPTSAKAMWLDPDGNVTVHGGITINGGIRGSVSFGAVEKPFNNYSRTLCTKVGSSNVTSITETSSQAVIYYGTSSSVTISYSLTIYDCTTAANIVTKNITLPSTPTSGSVIAIRFVFGITNSTQTKLSVNSGTGIAVTYNGSAFISSNGSVSAGDVVTMLYDGSGYRVLMIEKVSAATKLYANKIYLGADKYLIYEGGGLNFHDGSTVHNLT